jgi:HK97 family phage portal protein
MVWPTAAGVPITPWTSLRISTLFACVRLLAESASTLPLRVYQGEGTARTATRGPLALLLERPSPGNTGPNLIAQIVASIALQGNGYIGKVRNARGAIEQIVMIPPERVSIEVVEGEPFYRVAYDAPIGDVLHSTFDVLHIKLASLDGVHGLSPLQHARESMGLAVVVAEHASSTFANSAIPKGVLGVNTTGADSEDLIENLREGFSARHKGPRNAGRVAVIDATAISYSAVTLSPADAQLIEQMRLSDTAIARIMRVPPALVAAADGTNSLTYSNVSQSATDFIRWSAQPYLTAIEAAITTDPDLCGFGESVEFDASKFERPSPLEEAQAHLLGRQGQWLTADDARTDEGRPPLTEPVAPIQTGGIDALTGAA